jgi:CBS-domain-containing membrane protein
MDGDALSRDDTGHGVRTRRELRGRPVAEALAVHGKTLGPDDTAATARALLARHPVRVLPVVDGAAYVGAVDAATLAGVGDDDPVGPLATALVPARADCRTTDDAFAALDAAAATRLVVLAPDGSTYRGIVCLRGDRERLCISP